MNVRRLCVELAILALVCAPSAALAQPMTEGFALQQFDPTYAGDHFFAAPDAQVEGHLRPAAKLSPPPMRSTRCTEYSWLR